MSVECPYCHCVAASEPQDSGQLAICEQCGRQFVTPIDVSAARESNQTGSVKTRHAGSEPVASAAHRAPGESIDYLGIYINLDRSVERRLCVEVQLSQFHLADRYRRFPAIDGTQTRTYNSPLRPQEIGCFLSHFEILRENLAGQSHLHVVEDDVLFCRRTLEVLRSCISSGVLENFDIVFTDVLLPLGIHRIREFKKLFDDIVRQYGPVDADSFQGFKVIDLKDAFFAATSSYLVKQGSLAKLHQLLAGELERGPQLPLDLTLRHMAQTGVIRAGCTFPFVTSIRLDQTIHTTMSGRHAQDRGVLANNIARHMFFVDCDWQLCKTLGEDLWDRRPLDAHEEIISNLVHYKLFGDYKIF